MESKSYHFMAKQNDKGNKTLKNTTLYHAVQIKNVSGIIKMHPPV